MAVLFSLHIQSNKSKNSVFRIPNLILFPVSSENIQVRNRMQKNYLYFILKKFQFCNQSYIGHCFRASGSATIRLEYTLQTPYFTYFRNDTVLILLNFPFAIFQLLHCVLYAEKKSNFTQSFKKVSQVSESFKMIKRMVFKIYET